jgi:hypothetical protein
MKNLTLPIKSWVGRIFLLLIIGTLFLFYLAGVVMDQEQIISRQDQLLRQIESLRGGLKLKIPKKSLRHLKSWEFSAPLFK